MRALLLLLASLAGLSACSTDPIGVICTEEARPGIVVDVRDAGTGEPAAEGAVLTLSDPPFVQVVDQTTVQGLVLFGAVERPGTYDVMIEKAGFETWTREDVEVSLTPDECHVETVHLEARLETTP